jgi:tRNA pseudouridine55 synthase
MSADNPGFVLPVDKPVGPTSHDVVAMTRRALGLQRIGHTGTLDPFASGLLLLCVGWATRLSEYLTALDKSYEAVARLGVTTDTEDDQGSVLEERGGWDVLTHDEIDAAFDHLRGEILQVPPQFSAKKVDGEAMHRRARRGEQVDLPPAVVTVHNLELLGVELPFVRFRVRCSSGTYVRSLARELGTVLGVGAHLTELRRSSIGAYSVESAVSTDELGDAESVTRAAIDPLRAVSHLAVFDVATADASELAMGRPVPFDGPVPGGPVAISRDKALIAIGEAVGDRLHPRKVFAQ